LYGLAGVRIGYTLTNTDIHGNLQKATSVFTGNRVGLAGCLAALDDTEFVERSVANVVEGRKYLTTQLEAMNWEVFPSYANFIYANSKVDTAALAEKCKSRGLIIRGNFDYSRITVGTPAQNRRVIEILQEVLAQGV
jgi:histidinol-phosphate aminotransferase